MKLILITIIISLLISIYSCDNTQTKFSSIEGNNIYISLGNETKNILNQLIDIITYLPLYESNEGYFANAESITISDNRIYIFD